MVATCPPLCFAGFGTDRLRCEQVMKTAGRENPNRRATVPCNRAPGAAAQNRSCSFKWAAKQENVQPLQMCFFLTSLFIELTRTWKLHPMVLWPELSSRKNAAKSLAMAAGSSIGAKCPPRGKTVQRWMFYTRSIYERGGSTLGTVWWVKTPNVLGVSPYVVSRVLQR